MTFQGSRYHLPVAENKHKPSFCVRLIVHYTPLVGKDIVKDETCKISLKTNVNRWTFAINLEKELLTLNSSEEKCDFPQNLFFSLLDLYHTWMYSVISKFEFYQQKFWKLDFSYILVSTYISLILPLGLQRLIYLLSDFFIEKVHQPLMYGPICNIAVIDSFMSKVGAITDSNYSIKHQSKCCFGSIL